MSTSRTDVYSRITGKIVADLEHGVRTWLKPWNAEHAAGRIAKGVRVINPRDGEAPTTAAE